MSDFREKELAEFELLLLRFKAVIGTDREQKLMKGAEDWLKEHDQILAQEIVSKVKKAKESVSSQCGTNKYDFCFDLILNILKTNEQN